ncbi:hypothetical protein NC653_013020 [Populus alba x Populus x berolinensis]|uniref:non-specific serine/threonine protein kinase n=1 Tax=Populus alba x Populus x berolinensis TaxID=444605 RepID=A0AAD6QTM5_9ROSI|nr:hypothetical protein NC653_013020 [Populus alba x Populus x berolinensis]
MASIIFFLLLALSFAASAQRQTNITLGSSLTPITNSSWLSPSGLYAFGFFRQRDGYSIGVFLSGISQKTVVWAATRDDAPVPSNATLLFTSEGRVILRSAQGDETPIVSASQQASLASMSDSGNFVLYNSDREIIWQSFDHPTDTLLPTQQLRAGAELVSPVSETELSTGIYRLKMQNDGNLVQYPVSTPDAPQYAYFASGTYWAGGNVTLNLDPDGRLYLLNSTGFNIENITAGGYHTKETINIMKLDADGIFRLYSQNLTVNGNWSAVWSSTSNKCDPKGSCGLNGYCVMKDQEAECTCLPGFEFVAQGNWTSGCERDFKAESCKDKNGSSTYNMEELSNTEWEDVSYSVLSSTTKDNCKQACLEDCNCEAALFTDGQYCRKQRLPLRFGRRNLESSNLAVVKVGRPISTMDNKEPITEKKNLGTGRTILIISGSFVAFGLAMVSIFGIIVYRYHAYKRVPNNDASAQRQTNITLGSSLTPITNSSWLSPSGLYAFGFFRQRDGYSIGVFLSGISLQTVVWAARRDDAPVPSNATLLFTRNGRVVLTSAQGGETSIVSASQPASLASMSDSGNFVLYNSDREIIWQSFDHPTDTLLPTQQLRAGAELVSPVSETELSTGIFRLKMQTDGNLVQYPVNTPDAPPYAYFASGTYWAGANVTLNLDPDGRLYLLNPTGFNVKNITAGGYHTKETINMMKLDADGIFRLYSQNLTRNGNWSAVWSSTSDKCDPKGSCGLNGYCVLKDEEAECTCLPGFEFVAKGNWTSGCERDFSAESCKDKNGSSTYNMEELSNTEWEDVSYSVLSSTTKDNCKQACLEDCNCEAALFTDGQYCRKQRLPLRFGRTNLESSNLAVVKVGRPISTMDNKEPITEKKNLGTGRTILIISGSFVAFGLAMVSIFGIIVYRYHLLAYKRVPNNDGTALNEVFAPRAFTYAELEDVTGGFKEEIGRGSFGTVYKGIISSTQKVAAVKRLEKVLAEGEREFQNEMKVIGKTHHRNLVRLLGYCHDEHHRLLWVYQSFLDGDMDKLVGDEIVEKKQLDRMVKVGLWCTLDEPSLRPSMKKVLLMLEGTVEIPIPPSPTSFFTAI